MCRAELSHDAPVAAAIGACVLSSLFFPADVAREDGGDGDGDGGGDSAFDSDDSRLVVMAMISFIPYFNWLVRLWQRLLVLQIRLALCFLLTLLSLLCACDSIRVGFLRGLIPEKGDTPCIRSFTCFPTSGI